MSYPGLLALHLVAVIGFASALLLTAVSLPTLAPDDAAGIARLRRLNLYVGSPALLLVWACGLAMGIEAGWFAMGWIKAKAALVLVLSAMHGRQMGTLRRLPRIRAKPGYRPLAIEAAALVAILVLVVEKPF